MVDEVDADEEEAGDIFGLKMFKNSNFACFQPLHATKFSRLEGVKLELMRLLFLEWHGEWWLLQG